MKFTEAYEAIMVVLPRAETAAQLKKRTDDHAAGNRTAFSYLMDACLRSTDAGSIASGYRGTWANELIELLRKRSIEMIECMLSDICAITCWNESHMDKLLSHKITIYSYDYL